MKQLFLFFLICISNITFCQTILWLDDFSNAENWTIDNNGQVGTQFGWNINNTSQGWWSTSGNGMNTTNISGGNNAELVNGNPNLGTQAMNVVYTLTTSTAVNLNNLNGLNNIFLRFEQYGARFNDLQEIQISTNGTTFITISNNLNHPPLTSAGGSPYPNSESKIINISQYLSQNQNQIWVRFRWTTNTPNAINGSNAWPAYGWYIDDVKIVQDNTQPVTQAINAFTCNSYISPTNQIYSQSGVYNETLQNVYGLDSVIYTINLTVSNAVNVINSSICSGSSYWLNGISYGQPGQYVQTLVSSQGCDSTIILNLTFTPLNTSTINISICPGSQYTLNSQTYTTEGTFSQSFQTENGCDSVVTLHLTVFPNNFNPTFSSSQQLFTNPPFAIQFSNTTTNPSNYNFTWYWGDGTSTTSNNATVFHEYLTNGLYTVTLEATSVQTGCFDETTLTDYIYTTGGVSCTHSAIINQTGPISACSGQGVVLSCNYSPTYSYQWRRNGVYISGNNNDSLLVTQPGAYSVIISDNGCPVSSSQVTVNFSTIAAPVISSNGSIQPCVGGSVTLSTTTGFTSYLWSNGATTPSTNVTSSGSYTVQVTNSSGCSATSNPFTINASILPTQNICVVGVDSLTNNIRVVWEKPITSAIDSFYVYRETSVSNVYSQVGARPYDSLSVWLDPIANPAVQAYRYKLTALDTCGSETPLSNFHKTIHLTINQGVGNAWNLIWSNYEGISFGSYNIYRGTTLNNLSLLTSIQSNLNSYTDLSAPSGNVYYQIEIVNPNNCVPTKSINYSISKSNIVNTNSNSIDEINESSISVYPNPANELLIIESGILLNSKFRIIDAIGRTVYQGFLSSSKNSLDISSFSRGTYTLIVENLGKPVRFVKQ